MDMRSGLPDLIQTITSGVVQLVWTAGSDLKTTGSGFFTKGHLVTNYHVAIERPPQCDMCHIRFFADEPSKAQFRFTAKEIDAAIRGSSERTGYDYAVLDLPGLLKSKPYEFEFGREDKPRVGEPVALLGYPLGSWHVSCHAGIVSSVHSSGVASIIQIDASVNPGNSGGPLFDPNSGDVVGMVTRRETGLTKAFRDLMASFDENIRVLKAVNATMSIGDVDPIEVLIISQHQMQRVARELERSSNVGIGYAIKCDALRNEPALRS